MSKILYFGGLPTAPKVRKLEDAFPELLKLRGTIISHEQIERIVEEKKDSNRYHTIVAAWRRKVRRETGIVLSGRGEAKGVGYRVLTDDEQLTFSLNEKRSGARKIRSGYHAMHAVDESKLSEEKRLVRDHELVAFAKLQSLMIETRRQLSAPAVQEQKPVARPVSA